MHNVRLWALLALAFGLGALAGALVILSRPAEADQHSDPCQPVFALKVNFQPPGPPPYDYLADTGLVFADRGNGYSYGWSADVSALARRRNSAASPDLRYDTLIHMDRNTPPAAWEVAVPPGAYTVRLVAGDPTYFDSVTGVLAEGLEVVAGRHSSAQRWREGQITVEVNDGRLSLSAAPGSHYNKLAFVEITSLATGGPVSETSPTAAPEPTALPLPTAAPELTALPLPTAAPEPTALPLPTVAPSPTPPPSPTAQPPLAEVAEQWRVTELSLEAAQIYDDATAYRQVQVTARFDGPDGAQLIVPGFWDGGRSWKLRFTPPAPGLWRYTVSANNGDPGLAREGSLEAAPAPPGSRGFLRRDPANPTSFVFDDGSRHFMVGQTAYMIVLNALAGGGWRESVDQAAAHGFTKVRLLVYNWTPSPSPNNTYPDAEPFVPGDHNRLNLAYWQKLDEVVAYLGERGLVADLILFTDDERVFGTQDQDEAYTRYILARYAAYPHVIWCLTNEWEFTGKGQGYWDRIGAIVRGEDPWMARGDALRPLSIHHKTGGVEGGRFAFFGSSWPVHAVVQYGVRNDHLVHGDEWGYVSIARNLGRGMPVVNDELGYLGERNGDLELTREQMRRALWAIVATGGYGTTGDARLAATGRPFFTGDWLDDPAFGDVRRLVDFWTGRGISYWEMSARPELVQGSARAYALAHPSGEAVVYAAAGGTITLALAPGSYSAELYNPRDGVSTAAGELTGPTQLTMPDAEDWVIHIKPQ